MSTTKSLVQTLELLVMEVNDELAIQDINIQSYFKKLYILGNFLQSNGVKPDQLSKHRDVLQKLYAISQKDHGALVNIVETSDKNLLNEQIIDAIKLALKSYQYSMASANLRIKIQTTLFNTGLKLSYQEHFKKFIENSDIKVCEKTLLVMNMKNVIKDLKGILKDMPPAKKDAVINLIRKINSINESHQDNTKSTAATVKGLYTDAIMQAKEVLSGHRHPILLRAFSRMLRLIGYGVTAGGLYIWENTIKDKTPAWRSESNTEYRVMNMFTNANLVEKKMSMQA